MNIAHVQERTLFNGNLYTNFGRQNYRVTVSPYKLYCFYYLRCYHSPVIYINKAHSKCIIRSIHTPVQERTFILDCLTENPCFALKFHIFVTTHYTSTKLGIVIEDTYSQQTMNYNREKNIQAEYQNSNNIDKYVNETTKSVKNDRLFAAIREIFDVIGQNLDCSFYAHGSSSEMLSCWHKCHRNIINSQYIQILKKQPFS